MSKNVLPHIVISLLLGIFVTTAFAVKETPSPDKAETKTAEENKTPQQPLVRCIVILPPKGKPDKSLQNRMNLVLKDLQWWYACQMQAHGYGPKTFSLETDSKDKVIVHQTYLDEEPANDPDELMKSCVAKAEEKFGAFKERNGTVMLVLYGDYIWTDRKKYISKAHGRGCDKRWTFLTSWHYFNINPKGWNIQVPAKSFNDRGKNLGPIHARVIAAGCPDTPVGKVLSSGHGGIAHELGHAFGLHHPGKNDEQVKGDIMAADLWDMRGCFSKKFPDEYCVISARDAEILDKNPVFTVQKKVKPITPASAKWAVRGVKRKNK